MINFYLRFGVLGVFLLCSQWIFAQVSGRALHVQVGYEAFNASKINGWFLPSYPTLQKAYTTFGFSGYGVRNNVLLGGELQAKTGGTISNTAAKLTPCAANLAFNVGYVLLHKKGLTVFPIAGVGYGFFATRIWEAEKRYPAFVPEQVSMRENIVASQQGVTGSIAAGAEYILGKQNGSRTKGFSVGLRAGYNFMPASTKWRVNYTESIKGTSFGASGPFVRLLVGLGRIGSAQ
ncbi:hypothetical protein ACFQ4C_28435 [Larkinella insperata]|uniref:Outer membrane protein beta-barrel domain-containing protein n=1 Tax=Larkinella insperata TaxID=332158 RepID=A0ABW3QG73_9BACT|nr:hypothetical protein [Larkinella insperata]